MEPLKMTAALLVMSTMMASTPANAENAESDDRPTIQRRFARKDKTVFLHATGTTHIRNDFYDSFGLGADLGFYPFEALGIEARAIFLRTRLSAAAEQVKEETGLTPDARPQSLLLVAGPRWSFGYGKVLTVGRFVVHFDPQLVLEAGVARAETRWLPSGIAGLGLLLHFKWGLQAKLDFNASIQGEKRDRGWITSLGFMPVVGLGWNLRFGGKDAR